MTKDKNKLTGPIPTELGNLTKPDFFSFCKNFFYSTNTLLMVNECSHNFRNFLHLIKLSGKSNGW